ncbi:hypothetical protein [Ramlibacter pallidus]|uniref:Uncharacterized protein n=1 Tax=Ramlibacter pallidus TaxID=2780087 RepID=A0ABR9S9A1_9BURK|nr:hypothetical protein [Ramlibacter pallidus]MBE7370036.1 hypothetical protein [Ramlibacter pallidus]
MKKRGKLLTASETQFALRLALGPVRAWSDFLADLAREKPKGVHVRGFKLFPVARRHDRCERPLYDPAEVAAFISNVWAADPTLRRDWTGVAKLDVEFDDEPTLSWRMRRAEPIRV